MTTAGTTDERRHQPSGTPNAPRAPAASLAQQIRAFNQQQFASQSRPRKEKSASDVAYLLESDSDGSPPSPARASVKLESASDSDVDAEDEGYGDEYDEEAAALAMMSTLELLQSRGSHLVPVRRPKQRNVPHIAHAELAHAEERVVVLEAQLLDAEETICHLKAEKLAALRSVEKLTLALEAAQLTVSEQTARINIWQSPSTPLSSGRTVDGAHHHHQHIVTLRTSGNNKDSAQDDDATDSDDSSESIDELRAKVRRLHEQLRAQQESRLLEQEERMAVIREQEREIQQLQRECERLAEACEDRDVRLFQAFNGASPASKADTLELFDDDDRASLGLLAPRHRLLSRYSSSSADMGSESSDSIGTAAAASTGVNSAYPHWREELVRHPTPHFDLDSPEVQYLLHAWTSNVQKLQYLRVWFAHVAAPHRRLALDVPRSIELPRLLPEICDGFLVLVVPLLRKQTQRDIQVHLRQFSDHTDLRIRVIPR